MDSRILTAEAGLHRTRLLLGLTTGAAVVAWADARILELADVPAALIEVAATPPDDLSALRHALLPLAPEAEVPLLVAQILQDVARDLVAGRRSPADTTTVLGQMRRMLPLPVAVDAELDELIDTLMLAEVGVGTSVPEATDAVVAWAHARADGPKSSAG